VLREGGLLKARIFGSKLLYITLWTIGALLVLHLLGQFIVRIIGTDSIFLDELTWRFNVDLELNVPTWYSSFLAGLSALGAFFLRSYYSSAKASQATITTWFLIGFVLIAVAIDETAAFHELVLQATHINAGLGIEQSYIANAWFILLPAIATGLLIGLWFIYKQLPRKTFVRFAIAGSIYIFGAVAVEYFSIPFSDQAHFYNFVLTPVEEGLEMIGLWLMLRTVLLHIADQPKLPGRLKRLFDE
jgi:hypothetical protein